MKDKSRDKLNQQQQKMSEMRRKADRSTPFECETYLERPQDVFQNLKKQVKQLK